MTGAIIIRNASVLRLIAVISLLVLSCGYDQADAQVASFFKSTGKNIAHVAKSALDVALGIGKMTVFMTKNWNPTPETCPVSLILDKFSKEKIFNGTGLAETAQSTPVIFWHGMGDSAEGELDQDRVLIQRFYPNIPVLFVQIGETPEDDATAGFMIDSNYQVDQVCKAILKNRIIRQRGVFNAVGYSQGSQFLRAVIERCPLNDHDIYVRNYISIGGQHQGIFGLPGCEADNSCESYRRILTAAAYSDTLQSRSVQASYWHDPFQESKYKRKNKFIAEINNEKVVNELYRKNLLQLENMVLVKFSHDSMVIPKDSSHFGFFRPKTVKEVMPFTETDLYKEDRIGLRTLHESGRLHLLEADGDHLQYTGKWFLRTIINQFLNN